MADDPRLEAARYRLERDAPAEPPAPEKDAEGRRSARTPPPLSSSQVADLRVQEAMRRGDFENLPGAGKPLPGLGARHDPDWWIRRKIQDERLTGIGPPALVLRKEGEELHARLDALANETDVRAALEDFNRRVIEARRQLLGGPPVVTPTRDVDAEVQAWRDRRSARLRANAERAAAAQQQRRQSRRWLRGR